MEKVNERLFSKDLSLMISYTKNCKPILQDPNAHFHKLNHFVTLIDPSPTSKILLILRGHYNHKRNIDFIEFAVKNNVQILCLLPHTNHKLQPLDKTTIRSSEYHSSKEIRIYIRNNNQSLNVLNVIWQRLSNSIKR